MKKFLLFFSLILIGLSTACSKDPETPNVTPANENLSVRVMEVLPSKITVEVTTKDLSQVLFLPLTADNTTEVTQSLINNRGYKAAVPADGTYSITIPDLQVNTSYNIYFTGITTNDEYCPILKISQTTPDLNGVLNVFDIEQRSVKVHVNLPESTIEANNAFRWMFLDLASYNLLKMMKSGDPDAAMMVASFDKTYPQYVVSESRTLIFNNEPSNIYATDENGEVVTDIDEEGQETTRDLYDPLVPGEVIVLGMGEYAYGHITELIPSDVREKYGLGTHAQTGNDEFDYGYYLPLYDWGQWFEDGLPAEEAKYWTGFYNNQRIKLEEPEVITDGSIQFTINKESLLPYGGSFLIIPDAEILNYQMVVMSDYDYQSLLDDYLDGDESHLRWFLSSWAATQIVYAFTYTGPYEFIFNEEFVTVDPNVSYHLLLTGFCDNQGSKQVFLHDEFFLPAAKEQKPVMEITALNEFPIFNEEGEITGSRELTANEVAYNVKCTTKNAISIAYACNYTRDWSEALSSYGSNLSLIVTTAKQNNAYFTADDLAKANSDEGCYLLMYSREDASSTLGVVGYNSELAPSDAALCESRSRVEDPAERVESDLFESLNGDWTATATIAYVPVGSTKTEYMELQSKVTIGEVTYPDEIPAEFKAVYANSSDGYRSMWNTYTNWADKFNEKTRNQNRILMQGFDFQVPVEDYESDLRLAQPYDLMIADQESYNGYNTEACFWDFGPKWYLEIQKDGSVGVPFNYAYFAPMSNWTDYEYHLIAVGADAIYPYMTEGEGNNIKAINGYFPVEISSDKQTLTVKPMMQNEKPYYPNAAYYSTAEGWVAYNVIYSDIVLTRGWSEAESSRGLAPATRQTISNEAPAFAPAQMPKSMTTIPSIKPIKKAEIKMVSGKEEMFENGKKMLRARGFDIE